MSELPTEQRPIRMDPELAEAIEERIKAVKPSKRDDARTAVMAVYHSGTQGTFHDVLSAYDAAIAEAVG